MLFTKRFVVSNVSTCFFNLQLSDDGRSADVDALLAAVGGDLGCDVKSISAASFSADAWVWPGVFNFNGLDEALSSFYSCAEAAAIAVILMKKRPF